MKTDRYSLKYIIKDACVKGHTIGTEGQKLQREQLWVG